MSQQDEPKRYNSVLYLPNKTQGPKTIDYNGHVYFRYMDRLYIPDIPSAINTNTVIDLAEIRATLAESVIDRIYTQSVLKELYIASTKGIGGLRVMDFGCGNGNIISTIIEMDSQLWPEQIIGIDISETAVDAADERLESLDIGQAFRIFPDKPLPFEPHYFDAGLANFVLQFDISLFNVSEIFRVMRTNSSFVYNDYMYAQYPEHYNQVKSYFSHVGFKVSERIQVFTQTHGGENRFREQMIVTCEKP